MPYIPRSIEARLGKATESFKAILGTGPRQVGKSTLLKTLFPERKYISLDDPFLEEQANQNGSMFMMLNQPPIIIDQVQHAPILFRYIKIQCDETDAKGLFCLSSSQQFKLIKNVSETLSGRITILELPGLSLREIQGGAFQVLDKIPGKKRGTGAVVCACPQPGQLRENVLQIPVWYV